MVRFEVFTAVTMKHAVSLHVEQCGSIINRRFGQTLRLHLQGRKNNRLTLFFVRIISSTLKMEETRSSEMSFYNKSTQCDTPEDGILRSLKVFDTGALWRIFVAAALFASC
jgi:hypothetical protein